jgi:hypothetical protein
VFAQDFKFYPVIWTNWPRLVSYWKVRVGRLSILARTKSSEHGPATVSAIATDSSAASQKVQDPVAIFPPKTSNEIRFDGLSKRNKSGQVHGLLFA